MQNNNQNSLLGFLKKKSLFSNSPTKRKDRSRSKSKDSRGSKGRASMKRLENDFETHEGSSQIVFKKNSQIISQNSHPLLNQALHTPSNNPQPQTPNNNFRYATDKKITKNPSPQQRNLNFASQNDKIFAFDEQNQPKKTNEFWTGLVSFATSFQSARVQSAQCLQSLSLKLRAEISSINYKIDTFNNKMVKLLNNQFKNLKQKVSSIVDDCFKESELIIRDYMRKEEEQLAGEVMGMKIYLEKELEKVEGMKDEINKPQWRKVAGQILSSELEQTIQLTIRKSSQMEIGQWELPDIGSYHIKSIDKEMKEMLKLKGTIVQ